MLSNEHASLLWQYEMGADELIASEALNQMIQQPKPAAARSQAGPVAAPVIVKAAPPAAQSHAEAEALAQAADSLSALRGAVENFEGCALKATARNTVFADGCENSDIMIIGEAPDSDEDRAGVPFSGVNGQLLDKMLGSIGLSRTENCYLTNTIFWRPPGNRTPTPEEMQICEPFLHKHIALFKPKLLILAGGTPANHLLKTGSGVAQLRGKEHIWHDGINGTDIPVRVIFHPSYLMRQPLHKKLAWHDLLEIKEIVTAG